MCHHCNKPYSHTVTLHDGRQCCNYCEDWRAECEARALLAMPTKHARMLYLYGHEEVQGVGIKRERKVVVITKGVKHVRGKQAADDLQALALKVWKASKQKSVA